MDGRAYLEKVIGDRLGSVRQVPEGSRTGTLNLPELEGIATGLIAAGALRPADAERILTDLRKTMARTSPRPVTADSPASKPLRVISLAGHTFIQGEVTITLVSLEVWSTMLILRSAVPTDHDWTPDTMIKFWDSRWRWRAWDDTGTQYRSTDSASSSLQDVVVDSRTFYPGPPEEARMLTLIVEHHEHQVAVEIPLV
ncbi:hypothetical protein JOF56_005674 [Kibdelosporangium banguiense]|uniref:Uncharacterized protein n=1 Tax=Kibdelosporangium banguiense TaxID=1365924 RepID=A0ABS4TLS9_9PSEU|nr:hypothetical protein [Kibdelosporangium banguiense]MBP2325289.1 hypothetical protein [Kibdelosporangium banguiense]